MFKNANVANSKQKLIATNQLNAVDVYVFLVKLAYLNEFFAEIDQNIE